VAKLQKTQVQGDKREAILSAALTLFAERGFHGTAVPLVAEKAGVGAGTLYRYFESKEALVNELYRRWKQKLVAEVLAIIPVDAPPRKQFHLYWQGMAAFFDHYPEEFHFLELHHHSPYLDPESHELERTTLGMIRGFVEEAQRRQQMKQVMPEVLMAIAHGAFVGLVKAQSLSYLPLTKEVLEQAENAIWEAIRL
jgi:TetR/AcrR family transcriptional regulator, repressor of fatR-cypB operon